MTTQENIKVKVNFYFEGQTRPFSSTEDFETLKHFLYITEESEYETYINEVLVENEAYIISDVKISILKKTNELHMQYGIDSALSGEPMPYNFRVSVYLRKK
jgi:hypothetical protein